jgi:hypothetical protein
MHMRPQLGVNADSVRACLSKLGQVSVGIMDHQMHIEHRRRSGAKRADHVGPKTDVGNEDAIHDVEM